MKFVKLICFLPLLVSALAFGHPQHAYAQIPDQAYISGVPGHAQAYSLSCESRSAADWSAYWGVFIDETEFLDRLPHSDNPNEGFVGNPNDPWGYIPPYSYGVHAEPVAELLRSYGLNAHAGNGLSWNEVRAEVAAGRPVIVWVIGSIWAGSAAEYETDDGQTVTVANNEHTMIVIGYDESRVHLVDALTGYTVTHTLENFLASWSVLGNMAIIGEGSGKLPTSESGEQADGETYTVQPGDTLNKVASRFGLYWPDLAAWNEIAYPYIIYPGQSLVLGDGFDQAEPQPEETDAAIYTIQPGENLLDAARESGFDWVSLARFNQIVPPFLVHAGDQLDLPPADKDIPMPDLPEIYTATNQESLILLSEYYGLDWLHIAAMNNVSFPYVLAPGQMILFCSCSLES